MADVLRSLYDGELELAQAVYFKGLSRDDNGIYKQDIALFEIDRTRAPQKFLAPDSDFFFIKDCHLRLNRGDMQSYIEKANEQKIAIPEIERGHQALCKMQSRRTLLSLARAASVASFVTMVYTNALTIIDKLGVLKDDTDFAEQIARARQPDRSSPYLVSTFGKSVYLTDSVEDARRTKVYEWQFSAAQGAIACQYLLQNPPAGTIRSKWNKTCSFLSALEVSSPLAVNAANAFSAYAASKNTPLSTDEARALLQSDQRYRQIINSPAKP